MSRELQELKEKWIENITIAMRENDHYKGLEQDLAGLVQRNFSIHTPLHHTVYCLLQKLQILHDGLYSCLCIFFPQYSSYLEWSSSRPQAIFSKKTSQNSKNKIIFKIPFRHLILLLNKFLKTIIMLFPSLCAWFTYGTVRYLEDTWHVAHSRYFNISLTKLYAKPCYQKLNILNYKTITYSYLMQF